MSDYLIKNQTDRSIGVRKCESLIRGDMLGSLYQKCEYQNSIRTSKLNKMLDDVAEELRLYGIYTKKLLDRIKELEESIND